MDEQDKELLKEAESFEKRLRQKLKLANEPVEFKPLKANDGAPVHPEPHSKRSSSSGAAGAPPRAPNGDGLGARDTPEPPPQPPALPPPSMAPLSGTALGELAAQFLEQKTVADKLFDADDIELKTRLSQDMVPAIASVLVESQADLMSGDQLEAAWVNAYMRLRVSILGEGRKEGVELTRGGMAGLTAEQAARLKG